MSPILNRRDFLLTTCAAAGLALRPRELVGQAADPSNRFGDYRALVCLFLFGGNDSFNMLVPRSSAEYNAYAASRQNMALTQEDLLPITPANPDGASYGLHPSMSALHRVFESGRAAFVNNVGPLIEPITKEQFQTRAAAFPPHLFSHIDQQAQWHSLRGMTLTDTGWGGRIADLLRDAVPAQHLPTTVSLSGSTMFQSADEVSAYTMGHAGARGYYGLGDSGIPLKRRQMLERVAASDHQSIYARAFGARQMSALSKGDDVAEALAAAPPLSTPFPDSPLGLQLATTARLIAMRDRFEMQRQIFFVGKTGFDTHSSQTALQPTLLEDVSESLAAFHSATVELGIAESVTTFTQSDFGRTLTSNGDGTDHGWGSIQIVLGGSVAGRRFYGAYPSLELDGPDDVRGGRILPTISTDQYAATLARWFGVSEDELDQVAPQLDNFNTRDLGFMIG